MSGFLHKYMYRKIEPLHHKKIMIFCFTILCDTFPPGFFLLNVRFNERRSIDAGRWP